MPVNIKDIEAWMDRGDYSSNEIFGLEGILRADKNAGREGYDRLTNDDFERLKVVGLMLSKLEQADPAHNSVGIGGEEWRKFGDVYSKIRRIIESLELEDIIDHVGFALGGTCFFHVAEKDLYRDYLYNQVRAILRKITPKTDDTAKRYVEAITEQEEVNDLLDFKAYVERDGFKALWDNSRVCGELKNHPEENVRGQFMAYLRGGRIYNKSSQYREVSEGAGFADVLNIEVNGVKRLFELKVLSDKHNRFQEGLDQLFDYMCKEGLTRGYYLVFDARNPSKRTEKYGKEYEKDQKTIRVIYIDIHPVAPTKKAEGEKQSKT